MRTYVILVLCFFLALPGAQAGRSAYKKILRKHTRHDETYQREDIYASINWHATWQSVDFLHAKVDKIAEIYHLDAAEEEAQKRREFEKFGDAESFFVSFYSYDYRTADLTHTQENWRLTLVVDGESYAPLRIEKLSRLTPLKQVLFPYSNTWARHYFVYFPRVKDFGKKLHLRVDGPYGHSELVW